MTSQDRMTSLSLIFLTLVGVVYSAAPNKIPSYLEICQRTPEIDKCISRSIQKLLPAVAKGSPELGFPQFDPYIDEYNKIEHKMANAEGSLELIKVNTIGWTKCKVGQTRSNLHIKNPKKVYIEVDIFNPLIVLEGNFHAKGKILAFEIDSVGPFNISLKNVNSTWQITAVTEKLSDNEEHLVVKRFWMKPEIEKMNFYADGVFGKNHELNQATNEFTNSYWKVLYEEFLPSIQQIWNKTMSENANKLLSRFPLSQLILEP